MSAGRSYADVGQEAPPEGEDFVGLAEIAERLKVSRATASNWSGRRTISHFPDAIARPRMGPVYRWSEVQAWAKEKGYLP
jgi:hypothetical protein